MAIQAVDAARLTRARRVEALVERRLLEQRASLSAQRRSQDQDRARALSMMDGIVKNHERAHLEALGGAAGGAIQYSYVSGPGGSYASGGSIAVDLAPVPGDPEETLRKARRVIQAALAPGEPSAADLRVASRAYALEASARKELAAARSGEDGRARPALSEFA